jgi:hypothetical protein
MVPILYTFFLKTENEEIVSNSFYEARITLIPKQTNILQENYGPTTFMYTHVKILNVKK